MLQTYYYAVGAVIRELDEEGYVIESCVFINKEGEYSNEGLEQAIVHASEYDALKLAQSVQGQLVRVHRDYVECHSLDVKE